MRDASAVRSWAAKLARAVAVLVFAGLGLAWSSARARHWETPRATPSRFEDVGTVRAAAGETWLVAVHPTCPHCVAGLARVRARLAGTPDSARAVALIVDTGTRPDTGVLARLGDGPAWWDRRQVWRRRWGHRLYGEALHFDVSGTYRETVPADSVAPRAARRLTTSPPLGELHTERR